MSDDASAAAKSAAQHEAKASSHAWRETLPTFAVSFPRDPDLDRVVRAFTLGNFAQVRAEVPSIVSGTASDEVKAAARQLLARTSPDSLAVLLVGMGTALLVGLAGWYFAHAG